MTEVRTGVEANLERFQRREARAPMPELESFADSLYDALFPLAVVDAEADWHLAYFSGAIGAMFQSVADVARDTSEGPGWSAVVDLERCPNTWLPWLAQFVGVSVIPGSTPAEQRERIARTDGFRRGTPDALRAAAQATLTGNRTVLFRERDASAPDPPYTLEVVTLTGETPDPVATLAALVAQKPGGIILNFRTVLGQDWQAVKESGKTWRQVRAERADWRALRDNV